jgi:hypothetical protein
MYHRKNLMGGAMNAADVVRKFGGQTPLAKLLGINQSAVAYWVKRDTIPAKWHAQLLALAAPRDIPLKLADLNGMEAADPPESVPTQPINDLPAVQAPTASQFLFYGSPEGTQKVRVILLDETVWASQRGMSEIFGVDVRTVNEHLQNVFGAEELTEDSVIRNFRITAVDGKSYETKFYNLDAIISVGYRVNSYQATQFRRWATGVLREYLVKGFAIDDERLKQGSQAFGKDYFDELLERIREIRASERRFYQKITDLYALSVDYDKNSPVTHNFYKSVQDKLHYAIHGHTSAELIYKRADASKRNMGLFSFKNAKVGGKVTKIDVTVGKNYLNEDELNGLNLLVSGYLDVAEGFAKRRIPMTMKDWAAKLDDFIRLNEYELLENFGQVNRVVADRHAVAEFEKFRVIQDRVFKSDFDKLVDDVRAKKRLAQAS